MISFLLWNINKKPIEFLIAKLANQLNIQVILLLESGLEPNTLLNELNCFKEPDFFYSPSNCTRIQVFSQFDEKFIKPIYETDKLTIRHLSLPGRKDILLAVNHFPSKTHWKDESQSLECVELAKDILFAEGKIGHSKTVLVGDLNMNPFENGVIGSLGLHAVMSRQIAQRGSRIVQKKKYQFFYNPMWSMLGDNSPGPPGTYYYASSEHVNYFWNMFDQIMIRPNLLNCFESHKLRIIDKIGNTSLITETGIPNNHIASDHLPISFCLKI